MIRTALACATSLLLCAGGALAQQPKMFPGTSFPGHDLYAVPTASPEDCANRCLAEQRCKAFTWSIPERRCQLKWDSSSYDGSLTHVSGIIEGRQASPPPTAAAPPQACAVPDAGACAGCSVTCSPGQKAQCSAGVVAGSTCSSNSTCACMAQ